MNSLWNDQDAGAFAGDDLAMRVYSSRLLGSSASLVLHGGGNTSVKSTVKDFFGREREVLFVKGSGWDLKTIEKPGFPALHLEDTQRLAELESLSDADMTQQLRALLLDPSSPSPSVEAILHAILPPKFVDHTHTDAVVTLTNTPNGEDIMRDIYADCLVLPYIMPGFILAKQVYEAVKGQDLSRYKGIILKHHGVFTFNDDAKVAYEDMIELVTRAERYLDTNDIRVAHTKPAEPDIDLLGLAAIRQAVSKARGRAQVAVLDSCEEARTYASRDDVAEIACRGPITPDHVIRTKRVPVILGEAPHTDVQGFVEQYQAYFECNKNPDLTMLDPAPRFGIWKNNGSVAFGNSLKECNIIKDISRHTRWAVQIGEQLGGWQPLPESEIFELEYWSLEQAKLKKGSASPKAHQGKVAIVTGAASGIGKATCEALTEDGAVVVGLDINPEVEAHLSAIGAQGLVCDMQDTECVREAIDKVVAQYGGLDIIVCNAGMFATGERIEHLSDEVWDNTMGLNLTATQRFIKLAIPYLKLGVDPSILIVGSRNCLAPGAGAAAYSVSKAGLTQLARVAALELAEHGIRVNVLHPDAVFDTGLWTQEALEASAKRYGLTVEEYKKKNILSTEITSRDVAKVLSVVASDVFSATTGAQIPFDGGNDRVI